MHNNSSIQAISRWLTAARMQDCYFCGAGSAHPLCPPCLDGLPRLPQALCPCCALPSPNGARCGRCLSEKPHFDATVAALAYAYPLDAAIQAYKYQGRLGLTRSFAALMDEALEVRAQAEAAADGLIAPVDLIIVTPLAAERLAGRGYNQAHELARVLAGRRRIKLDARALLRQKSAPPQAALPWKERAKNIRGAYAAARRLDGLSVAVVDDVMTTGSTLNEIARTLKKAGAARVANWVLARTLPAAMLPAKG